MASFPENYRGIHAISLLEKAENLNLDRLIELAYDPYLPGAEVLIRGLIEAGKLSSNLDAKQKAALKVLNSWDFKVDKSSVPMTLTQYYLDAYIASGLIEYRRKGFIKMINYMSTTDIRELPGILFKNSMIALQAFL